MEGYRTGGVSYAAFEKQMEEENRKKTKKNITVTVVKLSGDAILSSVEVSTTEVRDFLTTQVTDKLSEGERVWQITTSSGQLLTNTSNLVDGDILTVVIKDKPVPTVLQNQGARAELKVDGRVVAKGDIEAGGNCSEVREQLTSNVQSIYSTNLAFSALKADGSVVVWGNAQAGGDCTEVREQLISDVQCVYSTDLAFAALKVDGKVLAWGDNESGGDCSIVQGQVLDVQDIYSTRGAFAALKADATVVTWGKSIV